MTDNFKHAYDNAKCWLDEIRELYRESDTADAIDTNDTDLRDMIDTRIQEMPLEVSVRSGWQSPGQILTADAYRILLTTGGPALQIVGDLDQHGEPAGAQLEMQDWGTPWREVWPCEVAEMDETRNALTWFVNHFYFNA